MNDDRFQSKDILQSDEYFLSTEHSMTFNSLCSEENPLMQTSTMSLPNRSAKDQIYRADRYLTIDHSKINAIRRTRQSNDRVSSSESNTSIQMKNQAEKPLEKPRVFVYDHRNLLSSSSTSSTLSLKEKTLKEVGQTQ